LKPLIQFFGLHKITCDLTEVAHNACEPGIESCEPKSPHPEDSVLAVIDMSGHGDDEGVTLTIAAERAQIAGIGAQLETLGRRLRGIGKSWKRVAICRSCGAHAFDADNPPLIGRCPDCGETRFDIENLAGSAAESHVAASDCGGASRGTILNDIDDALRVRQQAHASCGMSDVALGFERARSVLSAMRGEARR